MLEESKIWKEYIKIVEDSKREKRFYEIIQSKSFSQIKTFLQNTLLDDPNPMMRIKAGEILLTNLKEKFIPKLIEIAQTDSMLEGFIGLVILLRPIIEKHGFPYQGLQTEPWVFDKLRELYSE